MPRLFISVWRAFSRHLYPPERLPLNNWCVSSVVATVRRWLPPAAPPVLCHLQLRCTCAQCPSLLVRESFRDLRLPEGFSLSFVCIPFQDSPRYGDLPVVKTNNPASVQLFCDCGLSFVRAKYKRAADQPICYAFTPRYALWRPAAIPNRKKVAIRGVFLFLGSLDRLKRRSGMNLGPACEQSGPGSAAGAFGRALGGVPGMQRWAALGTGLLAGVVEWHRACATNEGLGFMPGA